MQVGDLLTTHTLFYLCMHNLPQNDITMSAPAHHPLSVMVVMAAKWQDRLVPPVRCSRKEQHVNG